jgi:xylan 1,4-beta-xylosidase
MMTDHSARIRNPILPGFNPDPSIVRAGDDYYIATSTFEWYPGVQIHHSRDLVHWRLLTRPLNRASQLNMLATRIRAAFGLPASATPMASSGSSTRT